MILMSSVCEKCLKKDGCERYAQIRKMPDLIEVATCEWFVEDGIMRTKEEILDIINGVRSGNLEALETVLAALEYEGIKTVKLDPALCEAFNTILSALSQRQKSGKWIRTPLLTCDRCNKINKSGEETDYCPNCGCRMVEPQESEDKE